MANPYDNVGMVPDTQVRQALVGAMDTDPEHAAQVARISRQTGAPYEAVGDYLPEIEKSQKLGYYAELLKGHPVTSQFIQSKANAGVSHDDLDNLTGFERAARPFRAMAAGI